MKYKFGVYGDSIAYGYGNGGNSWFDILNDGQDKIKSAENGEKVGDVLRKIKHDNNQYQILAIAVGINDLLQKSNKPDTCNMESVLSIYRQILHIASKQADKIIVQSLLPVRESLFPNQMWLDEPQWVFNTDIEKFNLHLSAIAQENHSLFLDTYKIFVRYPLSEILLDAVHPNFKGQQILAQLYQELLYK